QDAEAEHMQRVLAAYDDQPGEWMTEDRAVARHEMDDRQREGEEADQANGREVGFIAGRFFQLIMEQGWNPVPQVMREPAQLDDDDGDRHGDRGARDPRPMRQRRLRGALRGAGGRADDEQELPGERIEEPSLVGRIR